VHIILVSVILRDEDEIAEINVVKSGISKNVKQMDSPYTYRPGMGSTQSPFQRKPRFPSGVNEAGA
jgi:hypothetical protein